MTLRARTRRILVRGSRAWYRWRGPKPMRPPEPPSYPSGWRTGPPHYVGLGAQKAGTSWWKSLIHRHPAVHRAGGQPKELHFFDRSWEEPFGLAVAEALAGGTPVITYPKGAMPEIVRDGETGFLVETEDEAVRALAKVGSIQRERCRRWIGERFTMDRMVTCYEQLYREIRPEA